MLLWIVLVLMTAAAVMAALLPLARRPAGEEDDRAGDLAVYRDQLAEIERDREAGLIGAPEAEAARTEVARRLLNAGPDRAAVASPIAARAAALVALVTVPALAFGLYAYIGSPQMPDLPLEARLAGKSGPEDIPAMIARVERHLADNPDDASGWQVLAPVYMSVDRPADAARAFAELARLSGRTPDLLEAQGEALVAAARGEVTPEALAVFHEALALDPDRVKALYYRALDHANAGRKAEALADLVHLTGVSPADAPWLPTVRAIIADLEGASPEPAPGPTGEDMAAAADMSPQDRQAMISGMVERLAGRLKETPDDPEGWSRLVNAYMVLGRPDDARAALAAARAALAADAAGLSRVEAAATAAGLAP